MNFLLLLSEFTKAKKLFIQAGNFLESIAISQHFIAYCFYNTDRRKEAIEEFEQVENFANNASYRWLQLAAKFIWVTGWSFRFIGFSFEPRKAKEEYLAELKISEEMR